MPLHIIVTNLNQHEYVRRKKWMIVKVWSPECMEAFENRKTALTTAPVLGFPDFALPFILEVDSSYQGVRVTFFQIPEGKEVFWLMLATKDHHSVMQKCSFKSTGKLTSPLFENGRLLIHHPGLHK